MSRVFYLVAMKNIPNESLILSYNLSACLLSRGKQSSPEKHYYSEISHDLVTPVHRIIFADNFWKLFK